MDPNAALKKMRELVLAMLEKEANAGGEPASLADMAQIGFDMAEQFQALDLWMSSGGFPPDAWTTKKKA